MTISLEQAQLRLAELIRTASPHEPIVIEDGGKAVAELHVKSQKRRQPGFMKGKIHFLADENDESHLEDFKEYME